MGGYIHMPTTPPWKLFVRTYVVLVELPQFSQKQSTFGRTKSKKKANGSIQVTDHSPKQRWPGSQTWTLPQLLNRCRFLREICRNLSHTDSFLCCLLSSPYWSRKDSFYPFHLKLSASALVKNDFFSLNLSWTDNFIKCNKSELLEKIRKKDIQNKSLNVLLLDSIDSINSMDSIRFNRFNKITLSNCYKNF